MRRDYGSLSESTTGLHEGTGERHELVESERGINKIDIGYGRYSLCLIQLRCDSFGRDDARGITIIGLAIGGLGGNGGRGRTTSKSGTITVDLIGLRYLARMAREVGVVG